jgi:hypothetical protein
LKGNHYQIVKEHGDTPLLPEIHPCFSRDLSFYHFFAYRQQGNEKFPVNYGKTYPITVQELASQLAATAIKTGYRSLGISSPRSARGNPQR